MNSKLLYDANCPVCANFVKFLQRKIKPSDLAFEAIHSDAKEFCFITNEGEKFEGEKGIDKLTELFPEVKSYFWMLPEKYRSAAVKATYRFGTTVRKMLKKDCDCDVGEDKISGHP